MEADTASKMKPVDCKIETSDNNTTALIVPDEGTSNVVPSLPEDKIYHAMFSFSSDDREWVRRTLETLEAAPYGIKCCIADRDFHPGQGILQNIEMTMHQSMTIILVLSPEHLDSHYCDFETGLAMELAHQKKCKVIPVLRRGEQVPAGLRFINYIDARYGMDPKEVICKLFEAIREGVDTKTSSYSLADPRYENGVEVRFTAVRRTCSAFNAIPEISFNNHNEWRMLGVNISERIGYLLVELANTSSYLLHHWYLYTHQGRAALCVMVYLQLFCLIFIITEGRLLGVYDPFSYFAAFLMAILAVLAVFPVILFLWRFYENDKRIRFCGMINTKLYKKKILFVIGDEKNSPVLRLVRYDVISCLEYIRENLITSNVCQHQEDEERLELATEVLEAAMLTYGRVLLDPSVVAPRTRHHVRRDLICVCQYVEKEGIHMGVISKKLSTTHKYRSRLGKMFSKMCGTAGDQSPEDGTSLLRDSENVAV